MHKKTGFGTKVLHPAPLRGILRKLGGTFMKKIILASASPRRKEILKQMGVQFSVLTGNCEENPTKTEPAEIVEELSRKKAWAAAGLIAQDCIVIGADTVVAYENKILGKPKDEEDAVRTLEMLQGETHQVYTGVTVLERKGEEWIPHSFSERTDVTFYPVDGQEIRRYVKSGEGMDKAGSYGIQGYFGGYVKKICGDYWNVVGLPAGRLFYETKKSGINLRG